MIDSNRVVKVLIVVKTAKVKVIFNRKKIKII